MFPHTITLYNVETAADPVSCEDKFINHITLLKSVLVDESKATTVRLSLSSRTSSLLADDNVTLYIPFSVTAADPLSGERKSFLPAADFWRTEDKSALWTLSAGLLKLPSASGCCFFIRGEAVHPDLDRNQLENLCAGNVFSVSSVSVRDFGGLRHWEVRAH